MPGAAAKTPLPSKPKRKDSVAEILLMKHLREIGFEWGVDYTREHQFHPDRKWRFDFAITGHGQPTAIEIEGGIWNRGAHVRGAHFESDARKYNQAVLLGWRVLRFSTQMVERAEDKAFLAELFGRKS